MPLKEACDGDLGFVYAPAWRADPAAPPLSASLPKRTKAFRKKECQRFLAGLLPEQTQREVVARALGVSPIAPCATSVTR
ncbi:MAG: HipA N-terminal domain-containing protein [Planctomycetota bacterium]